MKYAPALLCTLAVWLAGCQSPATSAMPAGSRAYAADASHEAGALYQGGSTAAAACTPAFNARLASLIEAPPQHNVDNVGVCGLSVRPSRTQRGGEHGDHQVISVRATTPSGQQYLIEVVTNDDLDGVVTANPNDSVVAFGQAFVPSRGQYAAGVHDVHCSTHRGADNGYVIVAGRRFPASCAPAGNDRGDRNRSRDAGVLPSF